MSNSIHKVSLPTLRHSHVAGPRPYFAGHALLFQMMKTPLFLYLMLAFVESDPQVTIVSRETCLLFIYCLLLYRQRQKIVPSHDTPSIVRLCSI